MSQGGLFQMLLSTVLVRVLYGFSTALVRLLYGFRIMGERGKEDGEGCGGKFFDFSKKRT